MKLSALLAPLIASRAVSMIAPRKKLKSTVAQANSERPYKKLGTRIPTNKKREFMLRKLGITA